MDRKKFIKNALGLAMVPMALNTITACSDDTTSSGAPPTDENCLSMVHNHQVQTLAIIIIIVLQYPKKT